MDRFKQGEHVIWMDDLGYGPVTAIVERDNANGYWCVTAPESKKQAKHRGERYFIWNRNVRKYLNRRMVIPEKRQE